MGGHKSPTKMRYVTRYASRETPLKNFTILHFNWQGSEKIAAGLAA
jgi:hypothetical protein